VLNGQEAILPHNRLEMQIWYDGYMELFWAALLGLVQGFTEFLPVSSSGHLVIFQRLLPSFSQPGVLFDVTLHFGTLFAVLFFFRKEIFKLSPKYLGYLVLGTIPVVIIGFFFKDQIEGLFNSVKLVGAALLITAFLNFFTSKKREGKKEINGFFAFVIGIFQAIAIIPGISRSGATIFAGVNLGMERKKAATFSFLLSVPAILGANLLEIISNLGKPVDFGFYSIGFIFAFLAGFLAIGLVLKLLQSSRYRLLSYYCIALGVVALLL
jgi:undecaprenyl-diphosphatase